MNKYVVKKEDENKRIDKLISEIYNDISRVTIQRIISEGKLLVNNNKVKSSYKVNTGDNIEFDLDKPEELNIKAQDIPLNVIYEDKDIIVINKEKGMVVHPGNGRTEDTLVNALMGRCKNSLSGIGGKIRPGIVHRLDKDTSGIIIVAKNDKSHINLSEQIKNRKVNKYYIALVRGNVLENNATINMPIARSTKDRKKMAVSENGKKAITHFKVLKKYNGYTLLELKIDTGRTHQIRVHLSEIGYPVVGDEVYSNGKNKFGVKGQCLHAKRIEFIHPTTNKKMILEAELPEYFKNILKELDKEE